MRADAVSIIGSGDNVLDVGGVDMMESRQVDMIWLALIEPSCCAKLVNAPMHFSRSKSSRRAG